MPGGALSRRGTSDGTERRWPEDATAGCVNRRKRSEDVEEPDGDAGPSPPSEKTDEARGVIEWLNRATRRERCVARRSALWSRSAGGEDLSGEDGVLESSRGGTADIRGRMAGLAVEDGTGLLGVWVLAEGVRGRGLAEGGMGLTVGVRGMVLAVGGRGVPPLRARNGRARGTRLSGTAGWKESAEAETETEGLTRREPAHEVTERQREKRRYA